MTDRVSASLAGKIVSAEAAAALIRSGMTLACSGFSRVGYPKAVPAALASSGHARDLTVITGASVGAEMDSAMVQAGLIARRFPYQNDKALRAAVNEGRLAYGDMHLSHCPRFMEENRIMPDVAIVECAAVSEEGILPTASLGIADSAVRMAKQVILEVNSTVPMSLLGMHDIPSAEQARDPHLTQPAERIGTERIPCPPEKIAAIVLTDDPGSFFSFGAGDENSAAISAHIVDFLKQEVAEGRLPKQLPPIQSGTGSVANSVLKGLAGGDFHDLSMYSEVFQDAALELMDQGVITRACATAFTFSREMTAHFYAHIDDYRGKICIRPQIMSNNPSVIRSLGLISINTALECDIYGNVNSSHQFGSKLMNGVGGSGDFARNARVSIFSTLSTAKNDAISCIVPMVTHVDHTEHDVQILVTEQGLADLRWKSPRERAALIIDRCAHPAYRQQLREYFDEACKRGGQTPHMLERAFDMHLQYEKTGSMQR